MPSFMVSYLSALIIFLGLDFIWLSLVMKNLYKAKLGPLLLDQPNFSIAGLFYLFYIIGVVVFSVLPALAQGNWSRALLTGALFGFLAYGTYDLTNLATLKNWPVSVAIIDILWGTFATAIAATASYFITCYFK